MAQRYPEYVKELQAAGKPASAARMIQGNVPGWWFERSRENGARSGPDTLHLQLTTYAQWNAATNHPLYGGASSSPKPN